MKTNSDRSLAWAYIRGQKAIDAFDRRETNAQLRCFALDRELERRREKGSSGSGNSPPKLLSANLGRLQNSHGLGTTDCRESA
jgi:hypothetical protein